MKLLFTIIIIPLFLTSCDFKNPAEALIPEKKQEKEELPSGPVPDLYTNGIPGLPYWPGQRIGGTYTKLTFDEMKSIARTILGMQYEAPDPREEIKEWLTLLAKVATGIGLAGMLAAAVLFVYQNPVWDDVGIVSAVSFSGGLTTAISYNLITIVVPVLTLCAVGYFVYIVYHKHTKSKATEKLALAFDLLAELGDEGDKVQTALRDAGVVDERIDRTIKKSLKKLNGKREKLKKSIVGA